MGDNNSIESTQHDHDGSGRLNLLIDLVIDESYTAYGMGISYGGSR